MTAPPPANALYRVPSTQRLVTTRTGIRIGCAYTPPPAPCHDAPCDEQELDWETVAWVIVVALSLLILAFFLIFWS